MGKRPDEEIQKKLVELELSIKDEDAKKQVPAASSAAAPGMQIAAATGTVQAGAGASADAKMTLDLYHWAGWGCIMFGLIMLFSHIVVTNVGGPFFWGTNSGAMGFLVIPLLIGIGMLFYDYKSRIAQLVTAGSMAAILLMVLNCLRLTFQTMYLLDFVLMGVPISVGGALLAKARYKHLAIAEKPEANK